MYIFFNLIIEWLSRQGTCGSSNPDCEKIKAEHSVGITNGNVPATTSTTTKKPGIFSGLFGKKKQ